MLKLPHLLSFFSNLANRWRSRRLSRRDLMHHCQLHPSAKVIRELHLVVDFQMLMVDMETLALVLVVLIGPVAPMVVDPVHLVDIVEREWVDMEHMVAVVPMEALGRRLLLGILAVMMELLVEVMMLVVAMGDLVKVMEDMLPVAVDMAVDMVLVLAVVMEETVLEVQCMEVGEAMVVLVPADITRMGDRERNVERSKAEFVFGLVILSSWPKIYTIRQLFES